MFNRFVHTQVANDYDSILQPIVDEIACSKNKPTQRYNFGRQDTERDVFKDKL